MSNSTKNNWREQSKNEEDLMILQSTAALKRNVLEPVSGLNGLSVLSGGHLHKITTFEFDEFVRQMAAELHETELMARMEGGDLIALEAKYHLQCLTVLRNRSITGA